MTDPSAKPHLRVYISGYFDDLGKQDILIALRSTATVEEFSPQRGGFPLPIEIILEIPWSEIVTGILASEVWQKIKSLYPSFREKQKAHPDHSWSTSIHLELRITAQETTVEASINSNDEAVAEAAIRAIPAAAEAVLSKSTKSKWERLVYNNASKRWHEPPKPPPGRG